MPTTLLDEPGKDPKRKPATTLVSQRAGTRLATPGAEIPAPAPGDRASDPVVGWLVVIAGPGRGAAVELGYGMNSVGRAGTNRVTVDFGDDQISSDDHFRVAYDQQSRAYHLVPAKGANLLYVDGKAVLTPLALAPMTDIRVGATVFRFVPLCGAACDWSMQASDAPPT
jgi:hypothetical protein